MDPIPNLLQATLGPPALPPAKPDWDAIARDVNCPLCQYNLRGLAEPRCPECGYQFEWHILLNPQNRDHPYLFEHHPRRNIWSFWKTAVGGLRPWRFWSSLRPDQPSRPRRLIAYWTATTLAALLLLAVTCLGYWVEDTIRYNTLLKHAPLRTYVYGSSPASFRANPPSPRSYFDYARFCRACRPVVEACLLVWALGAAWPWLTTATLMIFRTSMRQAKVRPIHTLRCVLYSADLFMWAAFAAAIVVWLAAGLVLLGARTLARGEWLGVIGWVSIAIALFSMFKLCVAYQKYLRFRHAWATVIASQIILVLAGLVVASNS